MINTRGDFYTRVIQENIFESECFDLSGEKLAIQSLKNNWVTFKNCTFNCDILEFKNINNPELVLEFIECSFDCELCFSNCILDRLSINDTKKIKSLDIRKGLSETNLFELNIFEFSNRANQEKTELETDFYISNINFKRIFSFENINHLKGKFQFIENNLGNNILNDGQFIFSNSTFTNIYFCRNHFNELTTFYNTNFKNNYEYLKSNTASFKNNKFYDNTFSKIDFTESKFDELIEFDKCDFLGTAWFENCKKSTNNHIKFIACKFERYSLFDNSKFNKIEILHSKFKEKASFENFETSYFKIHQVTFAESAYFDDLNKNNNLVIENWDRKTLRAIKRELVNTNNQIDYLRFKAYELNAYDKEKGKNYKDQVVLFFNKHSNYFGLDWTKGVFFIFLSSFTFYLLYLITYAIVMRYTLYFPNTFEDFSVTYLKFLNPFSFLKSPIEDAENYFFPYLSFTLGKIFISYGIYQTIQAFRKFGVNGG